jgi:hypothetical protein
MKDFTNYKILKYIYPFSTEKLEEMIWDKMTEEDSKWAIQLTLRGINDTGGSDTDSWDIFLLDEKLKNKIEEILNKYEVPYEVDDQSEFLMTNKTIFTSDFIEKIENYLDDHMTVDEVLDRILEVGLENLTVFEKYYLDNNVEIKNKFKKS